jgi:RecA-family ATPase
MKDEVFTRDRIQKKNQENNSNVQEFEGYELDIFKASDIKPRKQPWLWYGVIPLDTFTLFAGEGGIGKSQLLLYIAAMISTGEEFNACGEKYKFDQGNVIILSAEDDFEYQLAPKLMAANANLDNISIVKCVKGVISGNRKLLNLDLQLTLLEEKIIELGNVKLIIIDPIIYFIGKVKDYINTEVVNFLGGLNDLAKQYHLAIILNKHLRKKSSGTSITSAIDEVGGSGAWVNSARQSWIIVRDQEDKNKILFVNLKVNIHQKNSKALAYSVQPTMIYNKEGEAIPTTNLVWFDQMVDITADEAVNKEEYENSKTGGVIKFIVNYLRENGQSVQKTMRDAAINDGFTQRTFERAISILKKDENFSITNGIGKNKCWQYKE